MVETSHQSRVISEVQKLLEKGAIQEVSENEDSFYLRLFLVPEKDGQMCAVINFRPLNQFLVHNHLKMEGMHVVRDLQKNDWMTRIDLKDAYFSIPIDPRYQSFLQFKWQEGISVHVPILRPFISPKGLHKDPSPSCGVPTQQSDTLCDLSG